MWSCGKIKKKQLHPKLSLSLCVCVLQKGSHLLLQNCRGFGGGGHPRRAACSGDNLPRAWHHENGQKTGHCPHVAFCGDSVKKKNCPSPPLPVNKKRCLQAKEKREKSPWVSHEKKKRKREKSLERVVLCMCVCVSTVDVRQSFALIKRVR